MVDISNTSHIRYRPHIDGLRGIAILAVVLYHAKLFGITGGFVGVDVFFVISGFLITSIIVRDIRAGTFSLLGFWERRFRRIIPALIVVMLCSAIAAFFFILYPTDYRHFGNTLIAQSVFASNILFMLTDNYFDQPSKSSPLLHTWSLSVEEQFYVLFPFFVLFSMWLAQCAWVRHGMSRMGKWMALSVRVALQPIQRRPIACEVSQHPKGRESMNGERVLLIIVLFIAIVSFMSNVWFVDIASSARFVIPFFLHGAFSQTTYATVGFYFLPMRAWELALGIVIALCGIKIRMQYLAEAMSICGLMAILISVFLFDESTAFPGIVALIPTCGASAIILANEYHKTISGAMLSFSGLVWIGLISYSLYLWHWPLFVFAQIISPFPLSSWNMTGLVVLAFVCAWLSYTLIETPFRLKYIRMTRTQTISYGIISLLCIALVGVLIQKDEKGVMNRMPASARTFLEEVPDRTQSDSPCFQFPGDAARYGGLCRIGDTHTKLHPQFIVWGDSHAETLSPLFDTLGKKFGIQGVVFNQGACAPILGAHQSPPNPDCEQEKKFAMEYIRDNNIKYILLVARWSYYVRGGPDETSKGFITDSTHASRSEADASSVLERHMKSMIHEFVEGGRNVVIVKQVPEQFYFGTREAFYSAVHTHNVPSRAVSAEVHTAYQLSTNTILDRFVMEKGVSVIDPSKILCTDGITCELRAEGNFLYRDENHLSITGVFRIMPLFNPFFEYLSSHRM